MHINHGVAFERDLVLSLNNQKVKDLSNNLRALLKEIYGFLMPEEIVTAGLVEDWQKPDIYITYNDQTVYVSLKTGSSNVVHQEYISSFVEYLRENFISERTIETILLCHYSDGTIDGTGTERKTFQELQYIYQERIKEANEELNKEKEFVRKTIERCIFVGTTGHIEADYIYHGNLEYGEIMNKRQIFKHVQYRNWMYMDHLHIGPIIFRPHARYAEGEIKNPYNRTRVDFAYPNLDKDIHYISERYNG